MPYVDGFLLAVPKKNLPAYRTMSRAAGKIWKELGALEYRECVGDDLNATFGLPFPKLARTKPGETVVFSWILYRNKAHRNAVNKKVMADPRMDRMINGKKMPFDMKRMSYGGFKTIVDMA